MTETHWSPDFSDFDRKKAAYDKLMDFVEKEEGDSRKSSKNSVIAENETVPFPTLDLKPRLSGTG